MDKQTIINILTPLGEPQDSRRWGNYLAHGFSADDAPTLVELIEDDSFVESDGDEIWVPLHAWRALSQLMPAGLEELLKVLVVLTTDDWAMDEIPIVLAAAGKAGIEPLAAFVLDDEHDELARMIAVEGLGEMGKQPALRERAVAQLAHCMKTLSEGNAAIRGMTIAQLISLKAAETVDAIREVYAAGDVDWSICGDMEDVELGLGLRSQRDTPRPNYHADMFPDGFLDGFMDDDDDLEDDEPAIPQVIRTEPKVGRNDPCPCGSGKKYKKCCMP
ncbi:SEC-C motif domain protein [Thiothrix nivea DSM 5205]|uniref:SEC-C motif domain protein n=1 Tax=Thiothrix nivea (strain ATCC 35100 / DSM 5205 / JP2) TaxID=870187 RepID=A0A656HJD8_THINJ|nr:SEC-C motif domain protein [Thiothrix nivea DSM 5205]